MNKDWQDIATAPKDGTVCVVRRVHQRAVIAEGRAYFGEVTICYADSEDRTYRDVWVTEDGQHLFPTPTSWKSEAQS